MGVSGRDELSAKVHSADAAVRRDRPDESLNVVDSGMDQFDAQLEAWWSLAEPPLRALLRRSPVA